MKSWSLKPTEPNEGRPVIQIAQMPDGSVQVTGFISERYQAYELLRKANDYFVLKDKSKDKESEVKKNGFRA